MASNDDVRAAPNQASQLSERHENLGGGDPRSLTAPQKYFDLFELAPVGYVTLDRFGAILEINLAGAALLDRDRRYLTGSRFAACVAGADRDRFQAFFAAVAKTDGRATIELRLMPKESPSVDVMLSAVTSHGGADSMAYCQIAITDITARRSHERALQKLTASLADAEARSRQLLTELADAEARDRRRLAVELHDYLAQLVTLSRMHIVWARRAMGDGAVKDDFTAAQKAMDEVLACTRSLVSELNSQVFDNQGLPDAFTGLSRQLQERHGLQVEVRGAAEGFDLDAQRGDLAFQCVRELLWNVVKHARANQATLSYALEAGVLTVEVSDDGQGFDIEAKRGGDEGDNFGLFILAERVGRFGGRLDVDSQPGQGTRVRFSLPPRQSESALSSGELAPAEFLSAHAPRFTVALADDHAVVRRGLRQVLEDFADMTVVGEAGDGAAALDLARALKPDVMVMDVNMPKMDGIEATRRIIHELPGTIVVGLSVDSGDGIVQALRNAGASTCLNKERAGDEIHQAILNAVAERINGELRMEN